MREPSNNERYAFEVIRQITGARVVHHDTGTRNGSVDALLEIDGDTSGALEVTTCADTKRMEMEAQPLDFEVDSRSSWSLTVGQVTKVNVLREQTIRAIEWCDELGVDSLVEQRGSVPNNRDAARLIEKGCRLQRLPPPSNGPRQPMVHIALWGGAAVVDSSLHGLGQWLDAQADEPWLATNVIKLARTGLPELHLFVRVHGSGIPGSLFHGFFHEETITSPPPSRLGPLTDLWMLTGMHYRVLHWNVHAGWAWREFKATDDDVPPVRLAFEL